MGFLTVPELVEGRMQLVGASAEAIIVSEWTATNWNDQQIAQPYHSNVEEISKHQNIYS